MARSAPSERLDRARRRGRALGGGAVAGLIGGGVMSVAMLVGALVQGHDIWIDMKTAATQFLHDRAMQPGFDPLAVGLGVIGHLAVSVAWGVVFAAVWYGMSRGVTIAAGVLWGIVVWLAMYDVALPLAGLAQIARETPTDLAIVGHVMFGVAVAVGFLPYQRPRAHAVRVTHTATP